MERKQQLGNVAFGGAWSEQIAGREALRDALDLVSQAAARTADEDLTEDRELRAALDLCCAKHPKGLLLQAAFRKALDLNHPHLRMAELDRIAKALHAGYAAQNVGKNNHVQPLPTSKNS